MKLLSIVVPLYNDQHGLNVFYQHVIRDLKQLTVNYECIFIDNGSHDATLSILRNLTEKDFHCHYISTSHNLSVMEALYIGMQHAQGDDIVIMDIYHPTYMISKLYEVKEEKHASDIGGFLKAKNASSKKQKHLRIIDADIIMEYIAQQDFDGFKSYLNHDYKNILWLPYTNMEEKKNTQFQKLLSSLNIKYERRFIYILFYSLLTTLFFIPSILILHYQLEFEYSAYISVLLTLCIYAILEVMHSRYCCFHASTRQEKVKESTF
ncbi:glycosyltransferase [Amedibacillus sp. YH-ame6]